MALPSVQTYRMLLVSAPTMPTLATWQRNVVQGAIRPKKPRTVMHENTKRFRVGASQRAYFCALGSSVSCQN